MATFAHMLSVVAGILLIGATLPYIKSILKGNGKPSKVTWLLWTLLNALTVGGMYQAHTLNVQVSLGLVGDIAIFVLSLKYGVLKWTETEKWSLLGGFVGFVLWGITNTPLVAIIISLAIAIVASFPTMEKTWDRPELEDKAAWTIVSISSIFQMAAVVIDPKPISFENMSQPVVWFGVQFVLCVLIYVKPKRFFNRSVA